MPLRTAATRHFSRLAPRRKPVRTQTFTRVDQTRQEWWRDGLLYQVYPRSFADTNGDGYGDLRGVTRHLDHLARLGVTGVWLNPIHPSPDRDWGYDVADYTDVHPELGTLADFDELVAEAHARGIRMLLDLVPNHTSDEHPWFQAARASKASPYRDYYVWADPAADGGPPNNWVSMFGGSAWSLDAESGQYYLHNFTSRQPDLNWWSEELRCEFDRILRFWLGRGIGGFRVDVCHGIVKDRLLRDNPPATDDDRPSVRARGQQAVYNMNRPEVLDVLRRWRSTCDEFDAVLVGETGTYDLAQLATFYGTRRATDATRGDCLDLAFNFPFVHAPFEADALARTINETEALLPDYGQPIWTLSNHDSSRVTTRWAGGDERKLRLALMLLFGLRGTPLLYYGDELGLEDVEVPFGQIKDPLGFGTLPGKDGRDPCRTPMRWSRGAAGGFCPEHVAPWLPCAPADTPGAREELSDSHSILRLTIELARLRASEPDLRRAACIAETADGLLELRRGALRVRLNLSDAPVALGPGCVLAATDRAEASRGSLAPWSGVILRR